MKKSFMQMSSKVRFACASATQRAMPAEGGGDATSAASESQLAKLKSELEAEQKKRATAEMALKAQMAAIKSASSRPSVSEKQLSLFYVYIFTISYERSPGDWFLLWARRLVVSTLS